MALDAAGIRRDRRGLLRTIPFAQDETCVQVREVQVAQLFHGDRLVIELALLGWIVTLGDAAELHLGFLSCELRGPHAMEADRVPAASTLRAILDHVATLARDEDAKPEPGEVIVPDEIVLGARLCGVDYAFAEPSHSRPFDAVRLLPRKHHGSSSEQIIG